MKQVFRIGDMWQTRKGETATITAIDDTGLETVMAIKYKDGSEMLLNGEGKYYFNPKINSPHDLIFLLLGVGRGKPNGSH